MGVILLDATGRVLLMNRSAELIVNEKDGLSFDADGLRGARIGVPRIRSDFCDVECVAEIETDPASPRARFEEDIISRLILVRRKRAIVERGEARAICVERSGNQGNRPRCPGIVAHRRWDVFELEMLCRRCIDVAIDDEPDRKHRRPCERFHSHTLLHRRA